VQTSGPRASLRVHDYGDPYRVAHQLSRSALETLMSTAIARNYTKDGFVIAADGRMLDTADMRVATDKMQKIFPLGYDRTLAYTCCGIARIGSTTEEKEIAFDFITAFSACAQAMSSRPYRSLQDYLGRCARKMLSDLRIAIGNRTELPGEQLPHERGATIAEIVVDGYFKGFPSRAGIRFFHENHKLASPEVLSYMVYEDTQYLYGVPGIEVQIRLDGPLSRYLKLVDTVRGSVRLTDAVIAAIAYVEACASPEAKLLNKRASDAIGGHTHVATITLDGGFQWVPGFEPAKAQP
jgi:hypothetical protein